MAHVEYGCPNCEQVMYRSRTAVSALDFKPLQTITCKNCLSAVLWFEMLPTKRGKLWLGGDSGGFSGPPPTIAGTGSFYDETNSTNTVTITNVTVQAGSALIVWAMLFDAVAGTGATITWDGQDEGATSSFLGTPNPNGGVYFAMIDVASTATSDLVITCSSAAMISCTAVALIVTNVLVPSLDSIISHASFGSGSGTAPITSIDGTPTQTRSIAIAGTGTSGPVTDSSGSWTDGFTALTRTGTNGLTAGSNSTISLAFKYPNSLSAINAGKAGITSRQWAILEQNIRLA